MKRYLFKVLCNTTYLISIIFRIAAVCTNIQSPPSESNLRKLTATSVKEFQYAEYPCKADGKFDENGEEKTTFKILCPGANGESPDFKTDPPIGKRVFNTDLGSLIETGPVIGYL